MFTKKNERNAACSGFLGVAAVAVIFGILAFTLNSCGQGADEGPKKAATPVAYPPGGSYSSTQNVMLVSATDGAVIYYTTNGNTPTTSSAVFTSAIAISISTPLKAIAVHKDMANSKVLTEVYSLPFMEQAAIPEANPPGGTYSGTQFVTLDSATEGAAIYYTTDGSTPNLSSALYAGSIAVSTATTLRALAVKEGIADSSILSAIYIITNPDMGPLTEVKWLEILQGIEADSTFNGTLDLSGYTRSESTSGSGLRSNGILDLDSSIAIGKGKIKSIILPNTATGIVAGTSIFPTFSHFTKLESFSGALLSAVGDYAFAGCTELAMNALPAWLTSIGNNAFQGCTSLSQIALPANLRSIGSSAFQGCADLTQITLPENLTSIGNNAFQDCISLAQAVLPEKIASIGNNAFQGCTNLTLVTSTRAIPPALGTNVFSDVLNLEIRVPEEGVTAYRKAPGWSSYSYYIIIIDSTPVITIKTQPVAATVAQESINYSISVEAVVSPEAEHRCQWYKNTMYSRAGGEIIDGETNTSYTIPIDLTAGNYYYYCETRATGAEAVFSNVTVVTVTVPVITVNTQPSATTNVAFGSISGSLSVSASVYPAGPSLSYQWYNNTINSNTGGTAVSNDAPNASFTIPTNLAAGTHYYYCEIKAKGAATVRSSVATVNVYHITINTQPTATATVVQGNIIGSFSVAATVTPATALSYQWYSNTTNNSTGGIAINAATNASYAIPTNLTAGVYYYFCEVRAAGVTTVRSNASTLTVVTATDLNVNNWTNGAITALNGQQWFRFTATSSSQYIHVILGTLTNMYVQLYDSSYNPVETQKNLSNSTKFALFPLTNGQVYYIKVTPYSSSYSGTYLITFNDSVTPPENIIITINTQPLATTSVAQGSISGSLSVSASVTPSTTLSYQWYSNTTNSNTGGTTINGATGTSYTIPTTLTAGSYYYFCEVMATGAVPVRSSMATVNVTVPVITINTQPTATTNVTQGSITGSLSVAASVSPVGPSLSYQWYSNTTNSNTGGTAINGATSASYTIPTTLTAGTFYYICEVRATVATSVRSSVAVVNVVIPVITINTQPTATTNVTQGSITGSLSVAASVSPVGPSLSYQWYSNTTNSNTGGTSISGATSASYTIPTTLTAGTTGTSYYYFCEARAVGATSVRSTVARINVAPSNTVLTVNIWTNGNISSSGGQQWFSFTATASTQYIHVGFGTLTDLYVQVYDSNFSTVGAQTNLYSSTKSISRTLISGQVYYIKVTPYSTTGSGTFQISFNTSTTAPPSSITIITQPVATTSVAQGSISGSLSVAATVTPTATLSYQWYSNTTNSNTGGTAISGATSASYTIPTTLTAGTYYYFCEVRATGATSVRSSVATVNVYRITISTQPVATTSVAQGSISGSLSVAATVTPTATLSYQWYSNTTNSNTGGTAISGATGASYTIPTTLTAGTYYYFCEVRATGATSVRSSVATVTVISTIALTANTWASGNITTGSGFVLYSFPVTNGTIYRVWWDDSYQGSGAYTGDMKVSASYSGGSSIFSGVDSGYNTAQSFTANSTGTVILRVEPYNATTPSYLGTYRIVFSTGTARP